MDIESALGLRRPVWSGWILFALGCAALISVERYTVAVVTAEHVQLASAAAAVDLTVGVPLLAYLTLVRPGLTSSWLLLPAAAAGLVLARGIAPVGAGTGFIEVAFVAVEGTALFVLARRGRRIVAAYREARPGAPYAIDALFAALEATLGRALVVRFFAREATAVALALAGLWLHRRTPAESRAFSQSGGYYLFLGALFALGLVEITLVHLIVGHWSPTAAWVATGLSIYSLVWLAGDAQAVRLTPHLLTPTSLHLRVGLRAAADLPLDLIERVRPYAPTTDAATHRLVAMGTPRLVAELAEPVLATGLLGREHHVDRVAFSVDDERAFLEAMQSALAERRLGG